LPGGREITSRVGVDHFGVYTCKNPSTGDEESINITGGNVTFLLCREKLLHINGLRIYATCTV